MNILKLGLIFSGFLVVQAGHTFEANLAGNTQLMLPDSHAPIGVMGDHLHKKGEWMLSYRSMQMSMKNNLRGKNSISAEQIVTQVENPNGPPPTVRVVPTEMSTDMHMLGFMYAPSDKITLMLMLNYLQKEMEHLTYMGMMGATQLGKFTTSSSGVGDTKVSALYGLLDQNGHTIHLNLGLSLPTGSINKQDHVLTPMNTRPVLLMPYAMQLGSGTYDFEPGITYTGNQDRLAWGMQFLATLPLAENEQNYTWGNKYKLTAWSSYRVADWSSLSMRLTYTDESSIDGFDTRITAPVTTANPDNYGSNRLDFAIGVNLIGRRGEIRGHRLAFEYQSTIDQDVNGVQLEMQSMLTLGYQYAF